MSKYNYSHWTQARINSALERFIRDFYEEQNLELPATPSAYKAMAASADKGKSLKSRTYPPADAILRFYESFPAAWWKFGFLVEIKSRSKYVFTEEIDNKIREIYSYRFRSKERPADVPGPTQYSISIGFPEYVVKKRAQVLGLAFTKEPAWSPEEMKLLERIGYRTPSVIQREFLKSGFKRTVTSISLMRKRRRAHNASPYFSMNAVAVLFGVDSHKVKRWLERGWMNFIMKEKFSSPETKSLFGDTHLIHKDWIFDFIVKHPDAFDIKNVDQLWFLHIVTKGEVCLEYSKPEKIGKRSEAQQIEKPVENRKKHQKSSDTAHSGRPKDLPSAKQLANDKPHGTRIKYMSGCRCQLCRKANTDYEVSRSAARKAGGKIILVSAEYARNYLSLLSQQGVGYKTAAKKAGVAASIIYKIISGEKTQIRNVTEQKILSVTANDLANKALVNAAETWEKLNWLIGNGLTKTQIAGELGSKSKTPALIIGKNQITKETADKVERLYRKYIEHHKSVIQAGQQELSEKL